MIYGLSIDVNELNVIFGNYDKPNLLLHLEPKSQPPHPYTHTHPKAKEVLADLIQC